MGKRSVVSYLVDQTQNVCCTNACCCVGKTNDRGEAIEGVIPVCERDERSIAFSAESC